MEKANTNGTLEEIEVVGGLVVTDPEQSKTMIPPKTEIKIDSVKASELGLELELDGEFPPREPVVTGENKVEYVVDIVEVEKLEERIKQAKLGRKSNDGSSR